MWLIDPEDKQAWIHTSEQQRQAATILTTQNPDISLSLDEIFAALADEIEQ